MQVIKLERLDDGGIAQLSASMLGEAGQRPAVLELLKKESEGNVFFLVEVVRYLAEDAGNRRDIGSKTLPAQVFAGGVQKVIQRRLEQVPANARALLRAAAIVGRHLDLEVLRIIDPAIHLEEWLTACSNAAVLDVLNERWRFAHDKLREGLLSVMSDDERRNLHKQVAAALEKVYTEALDEQAVIIGEHYDQAGEQAQAIEWYIRAGQHARDTYAPESAISYYRKVLNFWNENSKQSPLSQQIQVYKWLGEMLNWQAAYNEAAQTFAAMRAIAETSGDKLAEAHAWYGIASTQMYQGELRLALESIAHVEEIARAQDAALELVRVLYMKGWSLFNLGNTEEALGLGEQVLALSEKHGYLPHTADSLNLLGVVHATLGQYQEAVSRFERALKTFQELGDRVQVAFMINNLGVIAEKLGDYQRALERYQEAITLAREIGHRNGEMLYRSNLCEARIRLGEYAAAESDLLQLIHIAETAGFGQLAPTYGFLAESYLGQAKLTEALQAAQRSLALGQEIGSQEYVAIAWRVLGKIAAAQNTPVMVAGDPGQLREADARTCFAESARICVEMGMEGERARTLRAWAEHELGSGDRTRGAALWEEARSVFTQIGAQREAESMTAMPAEINSSTK
jgi:tetratricopeptide (TPR) repeat protein